MLYCVPLPSEWDAIQQDLIGEDAQHANRHAGKI